MTIAQVKYLLLILAAVFFGPGLLSSCTNDLKDIKKIADQQNKTELDSTKGVNALFSDSGHVKGRIIAPLMLEILLSEKVKDPYKLFPKGVKIIMYDQYQQEKGNIVADTAYYYEVKKLILFKKNVVITSIKGDVFRSEELVWDQNMHKIYSNKPVDVKMAGGNVAHATAMDTNESLYPMNLQNSTGLFYLDRNFEQ